MKSAPHFFVYTPPWSSEGNCLFMEDFAMTYENLVRKAFDCGRQGVYFADAGYYRAALTDEKLIELRVFILISLELLANKKDQHAEEAGRIFEQLKEGEIDVDTALELVSRNIVV